MTVNQLGEKQMMEELAEHVEMNCPETPDSRYVAHSTNRQFPLSLGRGICGQPNYHRRG